jgi:hypothetical protein
MISVAVVALNCASQTQTLDNLQKTFDQYSKAPHFDSEKLIGVNQSVITLIEANSIKAPSDILKASNLISDFRNSFDLARVKHELTLAALAGGDKGARNQIKKSWDMFLISTGRQQRIGTMLIPGEQKFEVAPAPKSVRDVMIDPEAAVLRAGTAKSDVEVTKICADDQAAREGDFSKFTAKQMNDMAAGDKVRLKRIIELLEAGRVVTSEDFDHASLVLQHGSFWNEYCLAHELSICTLLLDSKKSPWLAAATYDRMLGSGGFHQRYGTQYMSYGNSNKFSLGPVDTTGIGDAERKAMRCPTLEEAKNRKWD